MSTRLRIAFVVHDYNRMFGHSRYVAELASRFQFVPPPPVVNAADVPKGQVLVHLCEEGMPENNAWPDAQLRPTETYREEAFGFFTVPHKYVDTGVRGAQGGVMMFGMMGSFLPVSLAITSKKSPAL